jgi:hypothetical protein
MPMYKAFITFEGSVYIEYEAMGDAEAGEVAADIFSDMDKGRLNMGDFDIKDITPTRMSQSEINERKHDTDERV